MELADDRVKYLVQVRGQYLGPELRPKLITQDFSQLREARDVGEDGAPVQSIRNLLT